jgi:PncC family amidohydrolase
MNNNLAAKIITKLTTTSKTLALAESLTGGLISSQFVSAQGSSKAYLGGLNLNSNWAKITLLDFESSELENGLVYSARVAQEMAEKVLSLLKTDFALATTGIAGPGGGSEQKPVGTYYIAIATINESRSKHFLASGTRQQIRDQATYNALKWLMEEVDIE